MNSRLDSIQAAVLRIKLRHLDAYIQARQAAAAAYDEAFARCLQLRIPERDRRAHVFHQYAAACWMAAAMPCVNTCSRPASRHDPLPRALLHCRRPAGLRHPAWRPAGDRGADGTGAEPAMSTELDHEHSHITGTVKAFFQ